MLFINFTFSASHQKTASHEKELQELKFQLDKAESALQVVTETGFKAKERETSMKEKLAKTERELDKFRLEARKASAELRETKNDLETQIKSLEKSCDVCFKFIDAQELLRFTILVLYRKY